MIWLVGCNGMLGTELGEVLNASRLEWLGTDREVSILDFNAITDFVKDKKVDCIVNCAAYTAVDKAEEDRELCYKLNVDGPENLAKLAKNIGAKVIHISTDYVFSGDGDRPYLESDATAPIGYYGETKALGEQKLLAVSADNVVVRTAWLYGKHGNNFVFTMLKLMKAKDSIGVVADQFGTPTWARDLANAIVTIAKNTKSFTGIYHFTNFGETNWHAFAKEIYAQGKEQGLLEHDCEVKALTTAEYPTKTKRPAYSVLSKGKIQKAGIIVPEWKESLSKFLKEINE